jgi:hypothetical protein
MEHKKVYNILCWKYSTWLGTGKKMLMESKSSPLDNLINYITSVSFINGSEMMIAQCQMSNISAILWPEQVTSNEMMSVLY